MKLTSLMVILSFLGSSLAWASSDMPPLRIGLRHSASELPEGCKDEGGASIGANHDRSVSQFNCRGQRFITFDRLTHKDSKGSPYWEVVDLTTLPALRKGESINDLDCTSPLGGFTLTIAKWRHSKDRSFADQVRYAVRLDTSAEKFEVLNPKQVKCEYRENRD
jgi:hypothetical protein